MVRELYAIENSTFAARKDKTVSDKGISYLIGPQKSLNVDSIKPVAPFSVN